MRIQFIRFAGISILVVAGWFAAASTADALPRHAPANPRGVMDPRGIADPRGVFDPRGPFDPRNPHRYMYGLPAGWRIYPYRGVQFYVVSGIYYYPYIINGQTVYVLAPVVGGAPTVPPRPY